ncbi:MAG: helix-turn-helix domain-containing protein [Chloroflexi bacterium]|nr:helix-turn-helix domain-containing protein [Chloroflexota bacterium]
MSTGDFVGISEACQILRVSETALRQWTDEGKIKAFVTPGGHRRYLVADLHKFMSSHQKSVGIRDLVVELEDAVNPLREIARTSLSAKAWYNKLDTDSQQHLANLGRNMLQVIIKYATEPSRREETMVMARDVGHGFGQTLAKLGLPLIDSVEAFILHRDPIMNAATHLMKRREACTGRFLEAIPLMDQVIDEALVSLVAAHQQYRNGIQRESEGDAVQ